MNLANKLTILRLILIPFYVVFLMLDPVLIASQQNIVFFSHIALTIFIVASLTDTFDGKIARKYNLVTDFGKFADPLADKILVVSAMVCFVALGRMPFWAVIIILAREFAISGFRLVVAGKGVVLAASMIAKVKTGWQMVMCGFMTFNMAALVAKQGWPEVVTTVYDILTQITMYVALALTIISMIDYFYKNRENFTTKK